MNKDKYITIISNKRKVVLSISAIIYVIMAGMKAEIHVSSGKIYETRMKISEIEENLGDGFIRVHRGCIVSVLAIHNITDSINLSNGESLIYTIRKKKRASSSFMQSKSELSVNSLMPVYP